VLSISNRYIQGRKNNASIHQPAIRRLLLAYGGANSAKRNIQQVTRG
jgi:hypothetical protein